MTALLLGLVFVAVTLVRSFWLWHTDGVNPYVIDHRDPLFRFVGQVFATVVGALIVYCLTIAIQPEMEQALGLITWANVDGTRWAGATLMATAIVWTAYAQFAMGSSWRIGIPEEATALRTHGPFALSRNPIFLGMLAFVAGLTIWSPSAVTLALLVATYISLEVQVRSEEAFLEGAHGQSYRDYRARVRRWI
ncbi:MAG: isoprenylcysteine carboxylmethyltransferase family protein [Alphaproteobacteria bacterium]|nr:isoprenylcysteine carboxylmethyltransferase family protein [Alphaproteobacteria bacterium]